MAYMLQPSICTQYVSTVVHRNLQSPIQSCRSLPSLFYLSGEISV